MKPHNKQVVLLVIDMQNGFLGQRSHHVLPAVLALVREFQGRGLPIIFTRFHNKFNSQYERLMGWTRLRSSPETDLTAELQQYAVTIVDKDVYSSLTPALLSMIEENNWHTFVLCGVATDGCVLKTAVDIFERDLVPIVVTDACASHAGDDIHKAGLSLLERFIGKTQLVTTDALMEKLNQEKSAS